MNKSIKAAIHEAGLKQWQVAKALHVSEFTLVRWLRDDLTQEREAAIYAAIEKLSAEEEKQ